MQVDYQYYAETYGGNSIKEKQWNHLAIKAEARLNGYTFGRLKPPWPEEAKTALCEMVEVFAQYEKRDGKVSENNDGYSVSYDVEKSLNEELYDIAASHLINTGLLDLGVFEE